MRNSLKILSLLLVSSLAPHASSAITPEDFSWSGKVPLTPPLVITETTQHPSAQAVMSFEITYRQNAPLTYLVTSSNGTDPTSEHSLRQAISSDTQMEAALTPHYNVTMLTNRDTQVISLRPTTSKHDVPRGTATRIIVASIF